jgi:hypothetical protein
MKLGNIEIKPQRVIAVIGIAILVFLVMDFNSRLEELYRLQKQASTVRVRATEVMSTQYNLQTAVAYSNSDLAVQEWARVQSGLVQPGDVRIEPMSEPGATQPAPLVPPVLEPTPLSNWDTWMIVVFGE